MTRLLYWLWQVIAVCNTILFAIDLVTGRPTFEHMVLATLALIFSKLILLEEEGQTRD